MTRPVVPSFRLAPLAALAALLLLAGCGLKGPLDPPPSAGPPEAQLDGEPVQPQPQAQRNPDVDPRRTPLRKNIFLDWLLD